MARQDGRPRRTCPTRARNSQAVLIADSPRDLLEHRGQEAEQAYHREAGEQSPRRTKPGRAVAQQRQVDHRRVPPKPFHQGEHGRQENCGDEQKSNGTRSQPSRPRVSAATNATSAAAKARAPTTSVRPRRGERDSRARTDRTPPRSARQHPAPHTRRRQDGIEPARSGPTAIPPLTNAPKLRSLGSCPGGGVGVDDQSQAARKSAAPAAPWAMRARVNSVVDGASAPRAVANPSANVPETKIRRRPKSSARLPPTSSRAARPSGPRLSGHAWAESGVCRSEAASRGSPSARCRSSGRPRWRHRHGEGEARALERVGAAGGPCSTAQGVPGRAAVVRPFPGAGISAVHELSVPSRPRWRGTYTSEFIH